MAISFIVWVIVCVIISLWWIHYHWTRRKLYELAAKIPGPTAYPIIGSAYLFISFKDIVENAVKCLEKYGSTIKIWMFSVLTVVISKPRHLQIALNSPGCLEKEIRYNFAKDAFGDGLLTAPAHIWKNHRKIINPTFNQKILDSFVDIFVKQGQILVEQLKSEVGKSDVFDVHEYLARCALDIICETAMGIEVQAQTKPSKFLHATRRAAQLIVERAVRVWLHPKCIFQCSARGREFFKLLYFAHNVTGKLVKKRYEDFHRNKEQQCVFEESARKPFLEHLLTLGDELTFLELRNEVDVFITAGSDTVTTTTGYVLVCLGMHQDIQEEVVNELDNIFGNTDGLLTVEDLPKLVYMERVIKETMRLYPPAPFVARSVTEDVDLGDLTLPAGSALLVAIIGTHRDPKIWTDPMKFDPDRFLPAKTAKRHPYSYIPFSAGPRNCIGKKFAMMSMKVLLSSILRSYKIDTNLRPENIKLSVEIISKIIGGSNIRITKRLSDHDNNSNVVTITGNICNVNIDLYCRKQYNKINKFY